MNPSASINFGTKADHNITNSIFCLKTKEYQCKTKTLDYQKMQFAQVMIIYFISLPYEQTHKS